MPFACSPTPSRPGSAAYRRLGALLQWLRPEDEKEKIDREQIQAQGTSAERVLAVFAQEKLLDYFENFILYYKDTQKIIAQNHQFIGVNKGYRGFPRAQRRGGRLGRLLAYPGLGQKFLHDLLCPQDLPQMTGNFSFVVVTDREDLDGQIYRNFLNTGTVRQADAAQPKDSEQMRDFLGQNKRLVFTLIQKFRWRQGQAVSRCCRTATTSS